MKHNIQQRSPEWLELRKNKIGSSDCPIIMGHNPYTNSLDLWKRRIAGVEVIKNHHMERGERLEKEALALFNQTLECNCVPQVWTHDEHPWMLASVDGYDEEKKILVEIKCPEKNDIKISSIYLYQVYHQMIVLGIQNAYLFFYWEGGKFDVHSVQLNETIVQQIIDEERRFLDCLENFSNPMKDLIVETDDWKEAVKLYREKKTQMEMLNNELSSIKAHMISLANERDVECDHVKLMKVIRQGSINYKAIPQLEGVNLQEYRNPPSEFWQFFDKEKNGN